MTERIRSKHPFVPAVLLFFFAGSLLAQETSEQAGDAAVADDDQQKAPSQFRDPEDGKFDISQYLLENLIGFMPIPLIITEPAVDNGLGLAGAFFHKPKADQMQPGDKNMILPNISVVAAAYTGNDSWLVGGGHFRNWSKDRFRYEVMGGYANVNLDWYGLGGGSGSDRSVRFNVTGAMLDQKFLARLGQSRWYMGSALRISNSDVTFDLGLPIELPPIENAIVGLSLVARYENLDFRLSPRDGFTSDLTATVYREAIGSDFNYDEFAWKLRQFFKFGDKYFFGWRLDGATTSGDVPFYMEPFIDLEGIPAMRYQGPTAATGEIRGGVDVTRRWSLLGFVGAGRTADSISDLSSASTYSAYGVGFRYLIARKLGMRVGLDVAEGPEGTYVYLIAGSAW